jgi:hypothetical protein
MAQFVDALLGVARAVVQQLGMVEEVRHRAHRNTGMPATSFALADRNCVAPLAALLPLNRYFRP